MKTIDHMRRIMDDLGNAPSVDDVIRLAIEMKTYADFLKAEAFERKRQTTGGVKTAWIRVSNNKPFADLYRLENEDGLMSLHWTRTMAETQARYKGYTLVDPPEVLT